MNGRPEETCLPLIIPDHSQTNYHGGLLGDIFQRDLTAYVLTWAYAHIISGDRWIAVATEVQEVEPFDDIVILTGEGQSTNLPTRYKYCHMIQAKHSKNPKYITPDNIKKELELLKYFRGYLRFRNSKTPNPLEYCETIQYMTIVTNNKMEIASFREQGYIIPEESGDDGLNDFVLPIIQDSKWVKFDAFPEHLEEYLLGSSYDATLLAKTIIDRMIDGVQINNNTKIFKKYQVALLINVLPDSFDASGSPLKKHFIDKIFSDSTNKSLFETEFSRLMKVRNPGGAEEELQNMKIQIPKSWYKTRDERFEPLNKIIVTQLVPSFKKLLVGIRKEEKNITLDEEFEWFPLIGHVFTCHEDEHQVYVFSHNFLYDQKLLLPLQSIDKYLWRGQFILNGLRLLLNKFEKSKLIGLRFYVKSKNFHSKCVLDLPTKQETNATEVDEFRKKLRLLVEAPTGDQIRLKISNKLFLIGSSIDTYFLESMVLDWTALKTDWKTEFNINPMFNNKGDAMPYQKHFDTIIVGAGFSGLSTLHTLKKEGFSVTIFEAGSGLGGTWFWNCYPAAQADNLNLSKDIQFNVRVIAARFHTTQNQWLVTTKNGKQSWTRNLILCTGFATQGYKPKFQREYSTTNIWPQDGRNSSGMRISIPGSSLGAIPVATSMQQRKADDDYDEAFYSRMYQFGGLKLQTKDSESDSTIEGILNINIYNGTGGKIQHKWKNGTITYLGITVAGYPNLFLVYEPAGSPNALCKNKESNKQNLSGIQGNWITCLLAYTRDEKFSRIESKHESESKWAKLVHDLWVEKLLQGDDVTGRRNETHCLSGGVLAYVEELKRVAEKNYEGFEFAQMICSSSSSGGRSSCSSASNE